MGIIGGTGSGKTTLVNLISRFYDADQGTVLLNGQDICKYSQADLCSKIGIVPQKAVLFKGTIRENMKLGRKMLLMKKSGKLFPWHRQKKS